jgi:hypothetical protein
LHRDWRHISFARVLRTQALWAPGGSPDWIWREDAITALLASHRHGHLFVAGCKTSQEKFSAATTEGTVAPISGHDDHEKVPR